VIASRLRPRPTRRPGLSLLEVLLALAIFLMSLVAIGGLIDFGSDQGMAASMQAAGTRLAQSKLAEVEAGAIDVASGGSGTFDDEPEWNWSVESTPTPYPNTYDVTVRVWRETSRRYEVTISQTVFDPAQMGNGSEAQPPTATSSGTGTATAGGN
jgi:general secretion pathway protein I